MWRTAEGAMRTRFDAKNYMRITKKLWNFKRVRVCLETPVKPARERSESAAGREKRGSAQDFVSPAAPK
jgi:hypothetical protein